MGFQPNRHKVTSYFVQNPCQSSPCQSGSTCQVGFTTKGYRCICQDGYNGAQCDSGKHLYYFTSSNIIFFSSSNQYVSKSPNFVDLVSYWFHHFLVKRKLSLTAPKLITRKHKKKETKRSYNYTRTVKDKILKL